MLPARRLCSSEPGRLHEQRRYSGPRDSRGARRAELRGDRSVDPSSVTSLGFGAQAVLDLVMGEHALPLAWLDSNIEYGPERGRSEITLAITAARAPLLMDRELAAGSDGAGSFDSDDFASLSPPCRDSLRIPATVAIATSSGALDEVVEGIFEAYEGDFAHGGVAIDLASIRGSFSAAPAIPGNGVLTASALTLELGFTELGASGAFALATTFESPDSIGMGTSGEIAHFPADNYCGPTAISASAEQTVRGLSVSQALASLNAANGTTVSYHTGGTAELHLDFSSAAERTCARFDASVYGNWPPGIMTLEFPGAVELSSTDGLIDGSIPLLISTTNQNAAGTIMTDAWAEVANTTDDARSAALPAEFGIQAMLDASEFDGVAVEFRSNVAGIGTNPSGLLIVDGLDVPDCVNNPPPRDPGARMSAPCAGTQRRTVWGARWGSPRD